MPPSRRRFLIQSSSVLATQLLPQTVGAAVSGQAVAAALAEDGFSATAPGAALLAVVGDVHIDLNPGPTNTALDDSLVAEINGLRPALTDLVLAGDLIMSHSNAVGQPRYELAYANARQEFSILRQQLGRFRPDLRLWMVPGNHDTDNQEIVPQLWLEMLGRPAYHRADLGGVPVFMLNSGHAGNLDPIQEQWLLEQARSIPGTQEVLVIAHHPSFFYHVAETGVKRSLVKAFGSRPAPVYVVGGHGHEFQRAAYTEGETLFVQMEVTAGSSKVGNDGRAPGYAIIALSGGRVVSRIFRSVKMDSTSRLEPAAAMASTPVRWPFERVAFPGRLIESHSSREGLVEFVASDVRSHFAYVGSMTWCFAMAPYLGKAREFLLLASVAEGIRSQVTVSFSATGGMGSWQTFPLPPHDGEFVHRLAIPPGLWGSAALWVRLSCGVARHGAGIAVGGWGIASNWSALTGYERWVAGRFGTYLPQTGSEWWRVSEAHGRSNLELFAFNLLPVSGLLDSSGNRTRQIESEQLSGEAVVALAPFDVIDFEFPRRVASLGLGIRYVLESSQDGVIWREQEEAGFVVKTVAVGWELVRLRTLVRTDPTMFYRIRIDQTLAAKSEFLSWQAARAVPGGTELDRDNNGMSDLLQFGLKDGMVTLWQGDSSPIAGYTPPEPRMVKSHELLTKVSYVRMAASARPGLRYILEEKAPAADWLEVPAAGRHETVERRVGEWERVETLILNRKAADSIFRVRVERTD